LFLLPTTALCVSFWCTNDTPEACLSRATWHDSLQPDEKDANTPDFWVPRHKGLIRLTGTHPFNCEPSLTVLMECGAITPAPLHFVRNHGAVPKLHWDTHRIAVCGKVPRKAVISMNQLVRMPALSLPVLLVCAGNRRKEQNMYDKTVGFNWGAAGLSNSIWTGVPLHVLLRRAGVTEITSERMFVCFKGPEGELPNGEDGCYGTSIPLAKALDPAQDVIVAFAQNGEKLRPDHGYPVRIIIPGYIGGRMIKWLTKIEVTSEPSTNFYHFHDNRILPPHVTAELADKDGWWEKPEYIFNELNINSAISSPSHDEVFSLSDRVNTTYIVKGYAYTGGGRVITRVELSLDGGHVWRLAAHDIPCAPTTYGKHWCWALWSLEVNCAELVSAGELMCRAWDEASNTQPRDLTWNLMGMGNNCHFRIKLMPAVAEGDGDVMRIAEHPTEPAMKQGGWMGSVPGGWKLRVDRLTALRAGETVPLSTPATSTGTVDSPADAKSHTRDWNIYPTSDLDSTVPAGVKLYTKCEVDKHTTADDCWIIVKERVYDVTGYLNEGKHPGGNASITMNAGDDATEDFAAVHSSKAWEQLDKFVIGYVSDHSKDAGLPGPPTPLRSTLPIMPIPTGPVNLLQYALGHPEMYDNTLVGEAAEAAAFNRMWAGAKHDVGNAPVALNPKKWVPLVIDAKVPLSHDSILLRLKLDSEAHQCGLPVGYHLYLRGEWNGKKVMRAYTPSSLNGTLGAVEFVIKIYFPNVNPSFPDGGMLTQFLNSKNVGDYIDVKGPMGHVEYKGKCSFFVDQKEMKVDRITMIGGGTGVAPMLQMIVAVLADSGDKTKIKFLYANKSEDDILLKYTLDRLQREHPKRFSVHYTVSKADDAWKGSVGRVNKDMIDEHCFPATGTKGTINVRNLNTVALLCGPPSLEEDTCIPALKALGYTDDMIIRY